MLLFHRLDGLRKQDHRDGFKPSIDLLSTCAVRLGGLKGFLSGRAVKLKQLKGLILAQNERWRRGLGMQVERESPQGEESGERESNT